jgi:hypothetical protein
MKRATEKLSGLLALLVGDAPTARAFTQVQLDAGSLSLTNAMADPDTCGAIFRVLDYLCKRDPGAVVDKANKNAWRWFCVTHYNGGGGEVEESANRNRAADKEAGSKKGQDALFWSIVEQAFEDAQNTRCAHRLFSAVEAADFKDYEAWLDFDENNMTTEDRKKLATLIEKLPNNLVHGLRHGTT